MSKSSNSPYNLKNKLEFITTDYLITWNPNTQINDTKEMNLTMKYNHYILEYFSQLSDFCTAYEINPEIKDDRLHFHGYVTVIAEPYFRRLFAKWISKLYKYGNIKKGIVCHSLMKAMEYSRKDQELMRQIITSPVPYKKETVLDYYRTFPKDNLLSTLLQGAFETKDKQNT